MTPETISAFNDLVLATYRLAQESPVDRFQDALLTAVRRQLPFDSSMWGTATMLPSGIDIHSIHLFNSSAAMLAAYERVKQQDTAALRVTQQNTATISFCVDEFEGAEHAQLRQFLHEFGHLNFVISSDINPRTMFVQWLSLYRADRAARFTACEVEFLSLFAPHLMQALAINRVLHLDQLTGDAARARWAVAIADKKGTLYHADQRFKDLLAKLSPGPAGAHLPAQLLRRFDGRERLVALNDVIVECNYEQGLLYLKARKRDKLDLLTARERLVAQLVSSGLTQAQVATRLERSPETIRSQVKSIFNKLDIHNVASLARMVAVEAG